MVSQAVRVESTAGVADVRLLSCSSGYALTVSPLPTVSPIVDPSSDPVTCPFTLRVLCPLFSMVTIYGDLSYIPGIIRQSVGTSRVFD